MDRGEELSVFTDAIKNAIKPIKEHFTEDEKKRAAYALNLCMVSVSQIIDYNDVYILEQEYEAILNNLNLEMFPKDEALLSILKQLLDTITFFRIQEGDKEMIEKEYQHKMKNAIWNAVPNFGLIVSGGSAVNLAVSLASQVGIGYMNYRRAKSENKLDYDKQQWQLRRTAIDQFNGLRRELFDTAWRLADRYEFPDYYRLTERQIKQYNDILMDSDDIKRYERLTTIKDTFKAYPPFWYNYGNTANSISRNPALKLSDETREYYKNEALLHFDSYWENNKFALLREDHMSSACALEQIDLLDVENDRAKIEELIDKAISFSGNANDILQLCSMAYMRIGQTEKAANIFRILVNEDYNKIVNAQLLSGLYVNKLLAGDDVAVRSKYELLTTRVNPIYLYRMPRLGDYVSADELEKEFNETQEELLVSKFNAVIDCFVDKCSIALAKTIPGADIKEEYPDYYFSEESFDIRKNDLWELFLSKHKQKDKRNFCKLLKDSDYVENYFRIMNRIFNDIMELNCIKDRRILQEKISNTISSNAPMLNTISGLIDSESITIESLNWLLNFSSLRFYDEFISELKNQIYQTISEMKDMIRYSEADSKLRDFCVNHDIPEPDILINIGTDAKSEDGIINKYFDLQLLDTTKEAREKERQKYNKVEEIIRNYSKRIEEFTEGSEIYFHDSLEYNKYFENSKLKNHKEILQKAIAIYNDRSKDNADVLFTVDSVVPIIKNSVKAPITYKKLIEDENNKDKTSCPVVNGPEVNGPVVNGQVVNGPVVNGPVVNGAVISDSTEQLSASNNQQNTSSTSGVDDNQDGKPFGIKSLLKAGIKLSSPVVSLISNVMDVHDVKEIESLIEVLKPMFEEICSVEF